MWVCKAADASSTVIAVDFFTSEECTAASALFFCAVEDVPLTTFLEADDWAALLGGLRVFGGLLALSMPPLGGLLCFAAEPWVARCDFSVDLL
mmetsp:Transcript_8019/g.9613  ORF Transcript_8019/g.9613 Transcript_8019/m.9613 type:complete len:93 (-) Transcript_8019:184-462(-)